MLTGELLPKFGLRMSSLDYEGKRKLKEIGIVSKHLIDMLISNRLYVIIFSKICSIANSAKKSTLIRWLDRAGPRKKVSFNLGLLH